jgi:hypothetical protein
MKLLDKLMCFFGFHDPELLNHQMDMACGVDVSEYKCRRCDANISITFYRGEVTVMTTKKKKEASNKNAD